MASQRSESDPQNPDDHERKWKVRKNRMDEDEAVAEDADEHDVFL
jgi:hypothetical protein